MKKKIFYFLLFISISVFAQKINSGKVIYEVSLKPVNVAKIVENEKVSKEDKQNALSIIKGTKNVNFELIFNGKESLYKLIQEMVSDAESKINLAQAVGGGNDIYYTNIKEEQSFYQKNSGGDYFLIEYIPQKWRLTQETKKIGSYMCYKAYLDKDSNYAWYTPEIPFNYGPKKYFGLPGLVLEVQIGGLNIRALEILLNLKEHAVIKKPAKGKVIKEEEFLKMYKEFFKNF